MEWILYTVVVLGWIVGFWLLNKLTMWVVIRTGWIFHTMENGNYLKMNESAQERFNWQDYEDELKDKDK
jgi:hypothetical protein